MRFVGLGLLLNGVAGCLVGFAIDCLLLVGFLCRVGWVCFIKVVVMETPTAEANLDPLNQNNHN